MTIDDKNILWLDLFDFLTYNKKLKLLETINKGTNLRSEFLTNPKIKEILTKEEFGKMSLCLQDEFLDKKLNKYKEDNIITITFNDKMYPYMLREISSPPLCLYCKGNVQLLNTFCIGVVGTRKPTEYGVLVTKQFTKDLVAADVTIVSGLAVGVDTIAHRTALENNGKTIAVLAGGFNHIYPTINQNLAKQMTENNLLISENNPDILPLSYYFPIRNRIIAGLSKGVLTTESGDKSGSLHTVNYAIEFNRDIFAVPGRINSPMSAGTNNIIKNYSGSAVLSGEDILSTYNLSKTEKDKTCQLDINEQMILNFIHSEKKTFQEILDHTNLTTSQLNSILLTLEIEGLVLKLSNNSYIMA